MKEFGELVNSNKINKDNINNALKEKADKNEINNIIKNMKNFEELNEKVKNIDNDLDRLIDNMKKQFKNIDNSINNLINSKIEIKDLESINKKISENNKNHMTIHNELNNYEKQI